MPATARAGTAETYHCYRCDKDKDAATGFYHHRDGSIVSGCKECHAQMARERKEARAKASSEAPSAVQGTLLGIVNDARPAPAAARYRCEGCGKIAETPHPEGPRGWKRVRVTHSEDDSPATLCVRCTGIVMKAAGVVATVAQRRNSGKGLKH
jgi:hypothetical protein